MANELEISEAKEVLLSSEAKLKWHNNMVEAHFSATAREMRMLVALSAHIDKNGDDFEYCTVSARDLGKLMNLDPDGAYKVLQDTVGKLFNKPIVFKSLEKTKEGKPKKVELYHIFYRLTYDNEHSVIGYQFSPAVKPLLLQVKSAYVETAIDIFMKFRCVYSSRIYMHVVQWSKLGTCTVPIAKLREQFALGKTYSLYSDFKRFVVEPALAEINTFSKYNVRAEFIKTGRKYTQVKFDIGVKNDLEAPIDVSAVSPGPKSGEKTGVQKEPKKKLTAEQEDICKLLSSAGLAKDYIKKTISFRSVEYIRANYDYCCKQQQEGTVKKMGAYLRTAIDKNYAGYVEGSAAVPPAVVPPSPDNMPGTKTSKPSVTPSDPEKEEKHKMHRFLVEELTYIEQEKRLAEIKAAIKNEQDDELKKRYYWIVESSEFNFEDNGFRWAVVCYLYRKAHPGAPSTYMEPKTTEELEAEQRAQADFKARQQEEFKKMAAKMSMPK